MNRTQLLVMCKDQCDVELSVNGHLRGVLGVPVWLPEEKRVATNAERAGLVTITKTKVLFGGYTEWLVKLVEKPVWIGGREVGNACSRAWNGDSDVRCHGDLASTATDVAILVDYLCRTIGHVYAGHFDRRFRNNAAAAAGMVDLYLVRVFKSAPSVAGAP